MIPADQQAPRGDARDRLAGLAPRERTLMQGALGAIAANRGADAMSALDRVLAIAPSHPEVLRLVALVRYQSGKPQEAIALLRKALTAWPDDAVLCSMTGGILGNLGAFDEALTLLRKACRIDPTLAAAWFNLARVQNTLGDVADANASLLRALTAAPDHHNARTLRANVLATLGDVAAAAGEYRRVIAHAPTFAEAWIGLADLKTVRFDAGEVLALANLYATRALPEKQHAAIALALGKALEDAQRFDEAFAAIAEGNAIIRRGIEWDGAAFSREVDAIESAFPELPPLPEHGGRGDEVIFIVSLPRSGSTLIEQMLAAHPHVDAASELTDLEAIIADESRVLGAPFAEWAARATPTQWQRLGEAYLHRTARWRGHGARFTDKMPDNWRFAGAAMAMLPGARILNARRAPVETGWSCFKHRFGAGRQLYSYDLAEIGAYWRDYDRLTRHWRRIAPERFLDVAYEALLADTETTLRGVLAFCGLRYDDACLRFHAATRPVRTASAAQVREPLRRDSARSARYGALLDPLRAALGAPAQAP